MNLQERIEDLELKYSNILKKVGNLQNQISALKPLCYECNVELLKSEITEYVCLICLNVYGNKNNNYCEQCYKNLGFVCYHCGKKACHYCWYRSLCCEK